MRRRFASQRIDTFLFSTPRALNASLSCWDHTISNNMWSAFNLGDAWFEGCPALYRLSYKLRKNFEGNVRVWRAFSNNANTYLYFLFCLSTLKERSVRCEGIEIHVQRPQRLKMQKGRYMYTTWSVQKHRQRVKKKKEKKKWKVSRMKACASS